MKSKENWRIVEEAFPLGQINHKETVFTTGNGYLSTRGSFEEGYPGEIATTFVHGVFNAVPTFGTELVNFPNPFSLQIVVGGEVLRLDQGRILAYQRELLLESGLLRRQITWESPKGKRATFLFERMIDMKNIHHAALRFKITQINFSGQVEVQAGLNGVVSNENYRHWQHVTQGQLAQNGCILGLRTSESQILAGLAQTTQLEFKGDIQVAYWDAQWTPTLVFTCEMAPGDTLTGEKHIAVYTSREVSDPLACAQRDQAKFSKAGFEESLKESNAVWKSLWGRSNVVIKGDDLVDKALRYNLFQILIAAPRHDDTVSIGAKTLSGYGYRGHVFWDTEIFILPFLIYTQPEIARNLLMYRYHTLEGARQKAKEKGYQGAMFAWESAATGTEVTPKWVVGPEGELIKIWCGEIEQHITADVTFAIRQYWEATGDDEFMRDYGAEIVLSAGKFYASRLEWDPADGFYHIRDVIGPDEYHEHVNDNAMTNLMAGWTLNYASRVSAWMRKNWPEDWQLLITALDLSADDIVAWEAMQEKIAIQDREDGVIEQFEGYFDLVHLDQSQLEPRQESLQSLFGIQGVQEYQYIKQPDVVMAQYLLWDQFNKAQIQTNVAYYSPRTDLTYGSSLGPSIQALMLARLGQVESAKDLFVKTLLIDLENNRGNTPHGIHAASAGAVWQVVVMGFAGLALSQEGPVFSPALPEKWESIQFQVMWKNQIIGFDK